MEKGQLFHLFHYIESLQMSGNIVPLVDLDIIESDLKLVESVIRSGYLVQGKYCNQVEGLIKEYIGSDHAVLFSNGTAPLYASLKYIDIGPGDEVILPAFSFVATANVVEQVGARPVFVDVDPKTWCLDISKIEPLITENTKAILPVHEFGYPIDLKGIYDLAKCYNISVIEDGACAFGSRRDNIMVGSESKFCTFSFHPRKIISCGEGGVLVTNDANVAKFMQIFRNHGMDVNLANNRDKFITSSLNFRLTDFQAALLLGQIERLEYQIQDRNALSQKYSRAFGDLGICIPNYECNVRSNWQSYHLMMPPGKRDQAIHELAVNGIQTTYGAQCIPALKYFKDKYKPNMNDYEISLSAFDNGLCIPMVNSEAERVIDMVSKIIGSVMNEK